LSLARLKRLVALTKPGRRQKSLSPPVSLTLMTTSAYQRTGRVIGNGQSTAGGDGDQGRRRCERDGGSIETTT
jgi:hypothetical protein